MGLLSDPKSRERFSRIAAKYNSPLCFLAYVVGVVWFLALAYKPFNHKTYFSENALLPGLVEGKFRTENTASRISQAMKEIKNVTRDGPMPVAWVVNQLRDLGLDTYTQEYIQTIPVPSASKSTELGKDMFVTLNGTNVYGILRAPRAASTEAIVLSAPYKHYLTMDHNNHAFGLMVALAAHFRKSSYWSKDIIFLLVDYDEIGMEAWLQEYHYTKSPLLKSSPLHGRSGSIQAAINLELNSDQVSHFNIKLEGLNGLLPNLDLVNLVVQLCNRERIPVKLHKQHDPFPPEGWPAFRQNLKTMSLMMLHQATGMPNGLHGLFLRYHIEAVTLEGVLEPGRATTGFYRMGRVLEGVFRSLNNLLERFHQSFFFYLLPASDRYVSIGMYMPPFGLILLVTALKAIALWISIGTPDPDPWEGGENVEIERIQSGKTEDGQGDNTVSRRGVTKIRTQNYSNGDGWSLVPVVACCQVAGFISSVSPMVMTGLGHLFSTKPYQAIITGATGMFFASLFMPMCITRYRLACTVNTLRLWKCAALVLQAIILAATAAANFSLGMLMAVTMVPVCAMVRPGKLRFLQAVLMLLVSPFGLLIVYTGLYLLLTETEYHGVFPSAIHLCTVVYYNILSGVIHGYVLGTWQYSLLALAVFPNWLFFWCIVFKKRDVPVVETKEEKKKS
ncbi:PREDICTED: glycosylphosphatidylinositol anchor attachment 1 protein-like [Branchiostoma belcheri]|uniref:Glycosylphosphatidylinositol anchor attachment 1 protein-like n=1 Tax=Branchiostoma belcheri TaxID=7741 RepID=A0A6P4ZE83_BRABE|nr:PREDICTED: glycosylphosphatidylinositol anchor attachment 1 protein-like [Branchiostoma belcheri]